MAVQDAACAALQARATAAAPKQTRVQYPASTRNQNTKHRRNTSTETEKPTRFQRAHNLRTNKESAQNNLNRQRKRRRKRPIHQSQRIKSPRHDRAIFQTANTHQDVHDPRNRNPLITTHRHPTPRRSHLPSLQSRQNLLATSKTGQEKTAPNRETAVTWHKEIRPVHNRQRSNTSAQRHIARCAVGQTNETEARENQCADRERGPTHSRLLQGLPRRKSRLDTSQTKTVSL